MDIGTCAKSLRKPDLCINELGRRKDVSGRGQQWIFPGGGQKWLHFILPTRK